MFYNPLVTQYVYQVYTESVYGNASAGFTSASIRVSTAPEALPGWILATRR